MSNDSLPILAYATPSARRRWFHWWALPLLWLEAALPLFILDQMDRQTRGPVASFPGDWLLFVWPARPPYGAGFVCAHYSAALLSLVALASVMDALRLGGRPLYLVWACWLPFTVLVIWVAGKFVTLEADSVSVMLNVHCGMLYMAGVAACVIGGPYRLCQLLFHRR